jgi:OmpA-OmpF porin, OOP family
MKKLNKVAMLFASAALAAPVVALAAAHSGAAPRVPTADELKAANNTANWKNGDGTLIWRNGTNEHCWRSGYWTPATAHPFCDGAAKPPPPPPVAEKVTFAADAFFDTGKSVLKPEARAKLDDLVDKTKGVNLEVIIAVGHTDSDGSDAYNQRLSVARSEAVKSYLTSKGVERNRVYTEGKGEKQPVADNKTREGKAKNRRVEIEVVGTRTRK